MCKKFNQKEDRGHFNGNVTLRKRRSIIVQDTEIVSDTGETERKYG